MRPHPDRAARTITAQRPAAAHGQVLPLILVLLGIMSLLAVQQVRTAVASAGLARALRAAASLESLANLNRARALAALDANPALLPPAASGARRAGATTTTALGSASADILFAGADAVCPGLAAPAVTREHYEIVTTARNRAGIQYREHQGFYICREICAAPCLGAVTQARASYWRTGRAPPP